jgi:DNA-binding transcriptional ArsR family regulator
MSPKTRNIPRRKFAPIFAALGDETRLSLIAKLSRGQPTSITDLTEGTRLSRQAVTKHLRVLQGARIVRSVRAGREKLFELDPAPIKQVGEYADAVSKQWDHALGRLKAFVERE